MSAAEPLCVPDIREMRESDLDRVTEIEKESFSTPWSRGSFRNLLARRDTELWVAEAEGEVVGYAVAWYVLGEAELGNVAVAGGWRRRGIGSRLLRWAVERSRARGTRRLYLEVRESNEGAQELYERHGFVQIGLRRRYYRSPVEDAKVMCLHLDRGTYTSS